MNLENLIFLITSIGSLQSLLIGLYFLSQRQKAPITYAVLGSLLICLGIRVGKSALYMYDPQSSELIFNLGFAAHVWSAPLLYLYLKHYPNQSWQTHQLWHLLPGLLILIGLPWLRLDNFWYWGGYSGLLFYSLWYLGGSLWVLNRHLTTVKGIERRWLWWLTLSVGALLVAYFSNYILGLTSYILGPLVYAVLIYFISYFVLINHSWFSKPPGSAKYKYLNLSRAQSQRYISEIQRVFQEDRCYLDPDFNLKVLAKQTAIPSYVLSHLFSHWLETKFVDYVNIHRIDEAKRRLMDKRTAHLKISAIAYDCGFNSLSSFNQAFKKFTAATPSQYRRQ